MEPTVPKTPDELTPGRTTTVDVGAIMQTLGTAFTQAAGHQADATRNQSDANVKIAEIQARNQIELAKMQNATHNKAMSLNALGVGALLLLASALVGVAFLTGRDEIAKYALTSFASGAAGFFAGRAKR